MSQSDYGWRSKWPLLLGAPLALSAGWIAYSALFVDRYQDLPPALPGERFTVDSPSGPINVYADGPEDGEPLLLIHSINAAGSAYEVRPLYLHYRTTRRVYAMDLPGFGFSNRDKRVYTPRTMTAAIHAAAEMIKGRHRPIDIIALSLSSEYAARATLERPDLYRSLGLVSPTGFDKVLSGDGPDESTRGNKVTLAVVSKKVWSRAFYDLLVSPPSMRFFLRKTWGSNDYDRGLYDYDQLTAHQPGAEHAVWSFLSGYLFPGDATRLYQEQVLPVWAIHGTRGDFVDHSRIGEVSSRPNWTIDVFETGAFPHFERIKDVSRSYDAFQSSLGNQQSEKYARLLPN